MQRYTVIALLALSILPVQAAASVREYSFKAWIDDRKVGSHNFTVTQDGDITKVQADARFVVKLLFVKVFDYQHTITEQWRGDCLVDVESATRSNGKKTTVSDAVIEGAACPSSFAYWDRAKISKPELLNGQTGEFLPSTLERVQRSRIPRTNIEADSYILTTSMGPIQLWYGDNDEWLALQSQVDDRTLTYVAKDLLTEDLATEAVLASRQI